MASARCGVRPARDRDRSRWQVLMHSVVGGVVITAVIGDVGAFKDDGLNVARTRGSQLSQTKPQKMPSASLSWWRCLPEPHLQRVIRRAPGWISTSVLTHL